MPRPGSLCRTHLKRRWQRRARSSSRVSSCVVPARVTSEARAMGDIDTRDEHDARRARLARTRSSILLSSTVSSPTRGRDEHDVRVGLVRSRPQPLVEIRRRVLRRPSSSSPKVHAWAIRLHDSTGVVVYRERGGRLSVGSSARVRSDPRKNTPGSLGVGAPPPGWFSLGFRGDWTPPSPSLALALSSLVLSPLSSSSSSACDT
jgi:hypothetical protein